MRVFVVVLIGLVVVLAVLTEVCLLQAAALRRKVRAVLPPDEREEDRCGGPPFDVAMVYRPFVRYPSC